jgi:phosphoribosylformylglycinamidine synthase PurS subunit
MTFRVHVRVMPRDGLLDPQGQAVEHALTALGFEEAGAVRVGRAIELAVAAGSRDEAEAKARQMCDRLLANPVTEDYLLEVEEDR